MGEKGVPGGWHCPSEGGTPLSYRQASLSAGKPAADSGGTLLYRNVLVFFLKTPLQSGSLRARTLTWKCGEESLGSHTSCCWPLPLAAHQETKVGWTVCRP